MGLNKKGFTIVEILVVIAIIGIVAAIVMPQFVKNINKNKSAAILGRAVEQIEVGCQNMIQAGNDNKEGGNLSDRLTGVAPSDLGADGDGSVAESDNLIALLPAYIGARSTTNAALSILEEDRENSADIEPDATFVFSKVPGFVYLLGNDEIGTEPDAEVATIYIDVNGSGSPNAFGADVFEYVLNNSCKMTMRD